jgi:NAD(P)-dependent dehydrogenase (short-subunit alcohol dehydrogenase family)
MNLPRIGRLAASILAALVAFAGVVGSAAERPARNPFLADSVYPLSHGDPAQQDALPVPGPENPGSELRADEIQYSPTGPAQFGAYTSGPYPDGRRVFWSNGLDRIVKVDFDSYEILATYWLPDARRWTEAEADDAIAAFDASNEGLGSIWRAYREASKLRDLSGVYTVLAADHTYYIADKSGVITAYGDADPKDPASAIVKKATFQLPPAVTGLTVGMNMTYDGWLIIPTEHGYVVALSRDLSQYHFVRLRHSEGAEDKATKPTGHGWVRNGVAIDEAGGLYIASQEHMHKVVWTGSGLSTDPADGAWASPYLNSWGHGSGATPSLMGFGDEDRFVVITDGEPLMNVVLFWRDAIPEDWERLPDAPDRRIAGMLPATMGDPDLQEIQSEQSVVVAGYGALVVNNVPRNAPWYLPAQAERLLVSYLGSEPQFQPYGVQKLEWDPENRALRYAWVNSEVSSPSCLPVVSYPSDRVYLIGASSEASATTRYSPAPSSTSWVASTTARPGVACGFYPQYQRGDSMGERLPGKIAIITGSGRGIGRACANLFAREGASVVVSDIAADTAEEATKSIVEAGGQAICHPADVTDPSQVDGLVERAVSEFGRLDIMFNNAGGALPEVTDEISDEDYRRVIALNLDGVFFGTRAALRLMVRQQSGCILSTTSGAGLGAVSGLASYGMAKAGVVNLAKSVADEYGKHGIRANVVSPGPIASEGFPAYLDSVDGSRQKMEDGVPVRRLGLPEDIANAALFLASDEASYVTGVVIPVDGGIACRYPTPTLEIPGR